jgi:hypothetical protein
VLAGLENSEDILDDLAERRKRLADFGKESRAPQCTFRIDAAQASFGRQNA